VNEIEIRSASLDDLNTLLEFEQQVVEAERPFNDDIKNGAVSYYDLEELILSTKAELLVAEFENKAIGSGYAKILKSKPYMKHEFHAYFGFMYVEPTFRGRGINKKILNSLKEWSRSHGVVNFSLDVYAENQSAISAYEKAGFKSNLIEMTMSLD
jgi:GNAT superfamily N-acetyltransferase